ncbi:hypothetical protein HDR60_02555 [bacterium]|nr:hypothetical protein [bacterium]
MKKIFSRKVLSVLGLFSLSGMAMLSISLPVSSQTKTSSKKTAVRKTGATASKSKNTSSKSTSAAVRKTGVTASVNKSTANASKRSLASTARSTSSARSSTASSRRSARVRKTIGNSLSFLNQLNDNSTLEEQECLEKYTECMDNQISSIISKYSFLTDDEALDTALDTGQPFRCAYYDVNSTLLKTNNDLLKDDKNICINSDVANCYTQRGVNELYSSYNYYCDINRSLKNNIGRKINQCNLSYGDTFATKYSIAYYNEVLNRMNGDGLQIINLESSTIYKNFLNQLNLQNMESYVLDPSISSEIFNELNLEQETELFSINVVPPIGASNYLASSQFNTASNSCFTVQDTTGMTSAQKKVATTKNQVASYLNEKCLSLKSNMERYYLTGKWQGIPLDENGKAIEGASSEDIESDFFSAKDSCNLYEQALISVRDSKYGEFDNQMQNWIEDNLAKMIQKKIKSTSSLEQAKTSLKSLDQDISFNMEKTAKEIQFNKMSTEAELSSIKTEYGLLVSDAKSKTINMQKNLAKSYADNYANSVLTKCTTMIQDSYNSICGSTGSKCFSKTSILNPYYTWISDIGNKAIKISMNGDIKTSHTNNKETSGYDDYVITKDNPSDTTKKEGYYPVYCKDVTKFNYNISFFSSLVNSVLVEYGEDIGKAVDENLKESFPEKVDSDV